MRMNTYACIYIHTYVYVYVSVYECVYVYLNKTLRCPRPRCWRTAQHLQPPGNKHLPPAVVSNTGQHALVVCSCTGGRQKTKNVSWKLCGVLHGQ